MKYFPFPFLPLFPYSPVYAASHDQAQHPRALSARQLALCIQKEALVADRHGRQRQQCRGAAQQDSCIGESVRAALRSAAGLSAEVKIEVQQCVAQKSPTLLPTAPGTACGEGLDYSKQRPELTEPIPRAVVGAGVGAELELNTADAQAVVVVCGSAFIMAEVRAQLGVQEPRDGEVLEQLQAYGSNPKAGSNSGIRDAQVR